MTRWESRWAGGTRPRTPIYSPRGLRRCRITWASYLFPCLHGSNNDCSKFKIFLACSWPYSSTLCSIGCSPYVTNQAVRLVGFTKTEHHDFCIKLKAYMQPFCWITLCTAEENTFNTNSKSCRSTVFIFFFFSHYVERRSVSGECFNFKLTIVLSWKKYLYWYRTSIHASCF